MAPSSDVDSSSSKSKRLSWFFLSSSSSTTSDTKDKRGSRNLSPFGPAQAINTTKSSPRNSLTLDAPYLHDLQAPSPLLAAPPGSRSSSPAPLSRPSTPHARPQTPTLSVPQAQADSPIRQEHAAKKLEKRRSWFPGGGKGRSREEQEPASKAWILGHKDRPIYDLTSLLEGRPVPELWDETGDTFVHLFPKAWNRGPSFRISSQLYASSAKLVELARQDIDTADKRSSGKLRRKPLESAIRDLQIGSPASLSSQRTTEISASSGSWHSGDEDRFNETPQTIVLNLSIDLSGQQGPQLSETDTQALIDIRNLFAFLAGQLLVATERHSTVFSVFMGISDSMQPYNLTNIDGSTHGEVADPSFCRYVEELNIGDIRSSREKTIEALVLGERLRSASLYNEAFVHAVGKYQDIQYISKFDGPDKKYGMISPTTRNRLERASIDLIAREKSVNLRLLDFDFPSIFAGVMNSKQVEERKSINFASWQSYFNATRRYVLSYLKIKYGSWPPKASSKKNDLETGGLNRIVLKALYFDLADLYDLYVDRTSLTRRTMGTLYEGTQADDPNPDEPIPRILRRVCDEYDHSCPPVQPPMPYDVPILPGIHHLPKASRPDPANPIAARIEARKLRLKKLSTGEISAVLKESTNGDAESVTDESQFLVAMRVFEAKQAKSCTLAELADLRAGMWIFIYAVLQALPMLVVDAPGVKWHHGVEYFLCEPPRSGVPWARQASGTGGRGWYSVSGGSGVVNLPSDLIEHGVEGIYRRSHCWLAANKWGASMQQRMPPQLANPAAHQYTIEDEQREQVSVRRHDTKRLAPPKISNLAPSDSRPGTPLTRPSSGHTSRRNSALGAELEALPLPPGIMPTNARSGQRAVSATGYDRTPSRDAPPLAPLPKQEPSTTAMTFDDILGGIEKEKGKTGMKK